MWAARVLLLMGLSMALGACDLFPDWLGDPEEPPLPGKRISVLALEHGVEPDPRIADLEVRLPHPYVNTEWPQAGGFPDRAMHHLAAAETLKPIWRVSVGEGSGDDGRILSTPVEAADRVFAVDAEGQISAYDANTGKRLWDILPTPDEDDEGGFGGGVAFANGHLYAATGFGEVLCLDPATGEIVWRKRIGIPMRDSPTIAGDRVFVVTYDNELWALDRRDGSVLWSNAGIAETAGLLGAASPAVEGDIVIAPYSSGELVALRVENGRTVWSDTLGFQQPGTGSLANLNDINGSPVIDRGVAYAVSHGGRLVAIDVRTGGRVWELDVAGINTPWIAGDFLYMVSMSGDVLCISTPHGRVKWVHSLPRFEDEENHEDPIFWSGPILVSDRLLLTGSNGEVVALSPYDGQPLGQIEVGDGMRLPPIVANETVYILTDEANLIALR